MITTATAIKGGTMVISGGLVAELVIFNDPMYSILAVVGAVVSGSGVIHELSNNPTGNNFWKVASEILKGVLLGFLAIPFWYLLLSAIGDKLLHKLLEIEIASKMENSVWLMIAFFMAWYTVPMTNRIVKFFVKKSEEIQ